MPPNILLVEDSPTIRNLLRMVLKQQGYSVSTAGDGLEGLEVLARNQVDLVITDVNMPRMDGFTFISRVRSQPAYAKLPIIVLSTESASRDRQEGISLGADLYLTKPVPPQVLVEHVQKLLP